MSKFRYPHPAQRGKAAAFEDEVEKHQGAKPVPFTTHRGSGSSLAWLSKWLPTALNYLKIDIYCPRGVQLSELLWLLAREKMLVE